MNVKCAVTDTDINLKKENEELKSILLSSLSTISEQEKVGSVFHDFNNILSSLMGYSSLSVERAQAYEDEKLVRYLENIERAGIRARDLVKETLEQRRYNRIKNTCSIKPLCTELCSHADLEIVKDSVYLEGSVFVFLVKLLLGLPERGLANLKVKTMPIEVGGCEACASEFAGEQLKVMFSDPEIASIEERDIRLAEAIISANGGHLCQSLVQDGQIVIYLRSVVSS